MGSRAWLLLPGNEIDHRRHAAVCAAFVHFALLLDDLHVAKSREGLFEHGAGVEVLDLARAARAVLQLLGRIALDDQEPAGFERLAHAAPFLPSLGRRAELS